MPDQTPFNSAQYTLERIKPKPRVGLSVQEVEEKTTGNYVFSFGFPGSGKTTFQWMLMNYLMNEGPLRVEIDIPSRAQGDDWEGRAIINTWKSQWIEGRFPDPNASGEQDVREVHLNVTTTSGKKLSTDFSFLEMSGELLQQVIPSSTTPPSLAPLLNAYLSNPRLKFCIVLLLSPDVEENDQLFASFISYLRKYFPGLIDRASIALIVSKPEESLRRLNEHGSTAGKSFLKLDSEALQAYANKFCGETYQVWQDWPNPQKTLLAPLHLGQIEQIDEEPRLVEVDFNHIEQIFFWLFKQFNGKEPGPTFFQKVLGNLNWK